MNNKTFLIFIISAAILAACKPTISEADLNTAVAEAIEQSTIAVPQATLTVDTGALGAELTDIQSQLEAANLIATDQAAQIIALEERMAKLYLTLTPAPTLIPMPTATIVILPTATKAALPEDQKFVTVTRQTGLYTYSEKNAKGYPIMEKTDPIIRYEAGDWILVYKALVQADGGALFYKVISPYGGGFYVDANHVVDQ